MFPLEHMDIIQIGLLVTQTILLDLLRNSLVIWR